MKVPAAAHRASRFDELGLRRAMAGPVLPLLVAAMALLAALAMAGWVGSSALARQWREGAESALTVQVPQPADPAAKGTTTRLAAAVAILTATPGVDFVHAMSDEELNTLLRPWLGTGAERLALPLPAVVAVRLARKDVDTVAIQRTLADAVPGSFLEDHGVWIQRLSALAFSLRACALLALCLVCAVAVAVIAVATRAGLAARRDAIEIVHGLGATDGFVAGRFASRATTLAGLGGLIGASMAVPVLIALTGLVAPFTGTTVSINSPEDALSVLSPTMWISVAMLPAATASIGFLTAQWTVRRWLRRFP